MAKVIEIISDDQDLARNAAFVAAMGMTDDPEEENRSYFYGDYWLDCDKVRADGITLPFNVCNNAEDTIFIVLNFDAYEYPEHAELCRLFAIELQLSAPRIFTRPDSGDTWNAFQEAKEAIAYRGGQGYCYGIYIKK